MAERRLQLHSPKNRIRRRSPRSTALGKSWSLRSTPVCGAAVSIRFGKVPNPCAEYFSQETFVPGRERSRLADDPAWQGPGLDGRGSENLQDSNRGDPERLLGARARNE